MWRKMSFESLLPHYITPLRALRPTESTIRSQMRRTRRRRLLSIRPLLLCVLSAGIFLVVMYVHTRQSQRTANAAAAAAAAASWRHDDRDDPWAREKGLVLSSSTTHHREQSGPSAHKDMTTMKTQFAIPPLHQLVPRRDESGDEDEDSEHYHNPSLYGWTPDVYPDPLANPIRCAIAYLPETNMTDGLR